MSKRYIGGTVRFDNQPKIKSASVGLNNFTLCQDCQRYIPNTSYAWHVGTVHPAKLLHVCTCPKCEAVSFTVRAGDIAGDCENVIACDYCGEIIIPNEYKGLVK